MREDGDPDRLCRPRGHRSSVPDHLRVERVDGSWRHAGSWRSWASGSRLPRISRRHRSIWNSSEPRSAISCMPPGCSEPPSPPRLAAADHARSSGRARRRGALARRSDVRRTDVDRRATIAAAATIWRSGIGRRTSAVLLAGVVLPLTVWQLAGESILPDTTGRGEAVGGFAQQATDSNGSWCGTPWHGQHPSARRSAGDPAPPSPPTSPPLGPRTSPGRRNLGGRARHRARDGRDIGLSGCGRAVGAAPVDGREGGAMPAGPCMGLRSRSCPGGVRPRRAGGPRADALALPVRKHGRRATTRAMEVTGRWRPSPRHPVGLPGGSADADPGHAGAMGTGPTARPGRSRRRCAVQPWRISAAERLALHLALDGRAGDAAAGERGREVIARGGEPTPVGRRRSAVGRRRGDAPSRRRGRRGLGRGAPRALPVGRCRGPGAGSDPGSEATRDLGEIPARQVRESAQVVTYAPADDTAAAPDRERRHGRAVRHPPAKHVPPAGAR